MRNGSAAARFIGRAIITAMAVTLPVSTASVAPAWAQPAFSTPAKPGSPMVTGAVVRDYARITFHWAERVDNFTADADGTRLTVRFDRRVNPNFGEILRTLYPYVTKAELSSDQRTIIFTLNNSYRTRTFITDAETGIDILGVSRTAAPQATAQATPPATTPPAVTPPAAVAAPAPAQPAASAQPAAAPKPPAMAWSKPPVPVAKPKPPAAPAAEVKTAVAAPVPEVREAPVPAPTVVAETPAPQEAPKEAPKAPEVKVAEVVAQQPAPEAAPAVAEVKPAAEPTPEPVPVASTVTLTNAAPEAILQKHAAVANQPITGEPLAVSHSIVNKQPTLIFPFTDRVASATWTRGRTAWVLFNKPRKLTGLEDVLQNSKGWLSAIRQYGNERFTLLRIDMLTDTYIVSEKDREGYGWNVRVSSNPVLAADAVSPELQNEGQGIVAFIPVGEADGPFKVYDPGMDETLEIVPVYASGTGISPPRSFIEFTLPATVQGVVVSPTADGVSVSRDDRGVSISVTGGMTISDEARNADTRVVNRGDNKLHLFKPTFFPNHKWETKDDSDFRNKERYFLSQATTAANLLDKNQWRKQLAELYLSEGMVNEALGVLGSIKRDDIEFFREHKLAALEGASHLINFRLPEAAISFSSNVLDGSEEADLLRKTVAAAGGEEAEPVPYMLHNDSYLRQYPPKLRQRIAIIAANHALRLRDFKTPPEIFSSLNEDGAQEGVEPYIAFMSGKVAAEAGRTVEARRIWQEMADNVDDRQFRARAEFALVLLGLQNETMKPEDAMGKLDKLRIVWRGDDLERSILMVLGQLNSNFGNYWDGMKAWEELMQYYPNTADSSDAYKRLAETFRMLYLDGGAQAMDPVRALALYSEFQELTPLGDEGNRVVENIVDVQVKIDLLEQAASRLQNLVQFRLQGEEKSRGGARLAVIYLLNREPEKAISALQASRVDDVPAALSLERNRIAAKALIDLKHFDQALTMIEGDFSTAGEEVRLEAYTKKEDWAYVVDILENMLRSRPDLNAPFSDDDGHRLVQLVLGYIFLGETEQLSFLRDAYLPLMQNNKYKAEFEFFTDDGAPTTQNFSKVTEGINNTESFMNSYRDKLKAEPLSQAVGNAPADANAEAPINPQ